MIHRLRSAGSSLSVIAGCIFNAVVVFFLVKLHDSCIVHQPCLHGGMRKIDGGMPNLVDSYGLRQSVGIERLLNGETNVSDLLQYLSELDPSPWEEVVKFVPVRIDREFSLFNKFGEGKSGRGDVLLTGAAAELAAIEVKLNHNVSDEQRQKYESWAGPVQAKLFLASLDPENELPSTGWIAIRIDELFMRWETSVVPLARDLAVDIARVFRRRRLEIEGLFLPIGTASAKSFAEIRNVDVMRIVTRSMRQRFRGLGIKSHAAVTLGGGNAIIQTMREVPCTELFFIAESRFDNNRAVLRFGVEGPNDPEGGIAVWNAAKSMGDGIGADRLVTYAEKHGLTSIVDGFVSKGSGRPKSKGDWEAALLRWDGVTPFSDHFRGLNPGFQRDGAYRLQAIGTLNLEHTNAASLVEMLRFTLDYLDEVWADCKPASE